MISNWCLVYVQFEIQLSFCPHTVCSATGSNVLSVHNVNMQGLAQCLVLHVTHNQTSKKSWHHEFIHYNSASARHSCIHLLCIMHILTYIKNNFKINLTAGKPNMFVPNAWPSLMQK